MKSLDMWGISSEFRAYHGKNKHMVDGDCIVGATIKLRLSVTFRFVAHDASILFLPPGCCGPGDGCDGGRSADCADAVTGMISSPVSAFDV